MSKKASSIVAGCLVVILLFISLQLMIAKMLGGNRIRVSSRIKPVNK